MYFNPFKPLIHNIKTLFLSNNQMNNNEKKMNKNAYSLGFVLCKPNHLDQKSCILDKNKKIFFIL